MIFEPPDQEEEDILNFAQNNNKRMQELHIAKGDDLVDEKDWDGNVYLDVASFCK